MSPSSSDGTEVKTSPEKADRAHHRPDGAGHAHAGLGRQALVGQDLAEPVLDVLVLPLVVLPVERLDGGLVALVEDEERPLGQHLVDESLEERRPLVEGGLVAHRLERVASEVVEAHVQRHQDVGLAGEVVVDRRLGEPEPLGDLAQRRLVVPLGGEQFEGDVEDPFPGRLARRPVLGLGTTSRADGSAPAGAAWVTAMDDPT